MSNARACIWNDGEGDCIMGLGESDDEALHNAANVNGPSEFGPCTFVDASPMAWEAWQGGNINELDFASDGSVAHVDELDRR